MENCFLPIFSPIFQNFSHFMHLWNTKNFGVVFGVVVPPGSWGVFLMTLDFFFLGGGGGCINPSIFWQKRLEVELFQFMRDRQIPELDYCYFI